jgi:hypothetical protein
MKLQCEEGVCTPSFGRGTAITFYFFNIRILIIGTVKLYDKVLKILITIFVPLHFIILI